MKLVFPFPAKVTEGIGRNYDVTFLNVPIFIHEKRRIISGGITGDPHGEGDDNRFGLEYVVENDNEIDQLSDEEKLKIDELTSDMEERLIAALKEANPQIKLDWAEWDRDWFGEDTWFIKMSFVITEPTQAPTPITFDMLPKELKDKYSK